MACSDGVITLKGGLTVPIDALRLAWDLEERGFSLTRVDGDTLSVQPYERLTRDDYQRIRRWKPQLLCVIDYRPEAIQ
jgi:hypothetical protein